MPRQFDREGKPLGLFEWAKLLDDPDYQRLVHTELENGYRVSTVWIGLDHPRAGDGPPLIFETMVFPEESGDMDRYATEAEALAGHEFMVDKWKGMPRP